ncbi:acyltransferase family protein [Glacieibacterium frigidum]|uniref:Acyltransferase n=1 Tax=Glacieibacterium frigidum TaxID=2593303 RepID=A0A552U728_9SPHN|nr:acyltransferase [Glacieibacterium frigidum]TRW14026.1 acyltransferase [Glacieibacterium frigidum]
MTRRYDLDWLRIGAFGLLILYHIGMVFVPWEFHIKTARPMQWVEAPMLLLNAWRLSLLFLISGVASRMMLRKGGSFGWGRTKRLFIPLVAGMALWIAPQAWVDLRVNYNYPHGFVYYWQHDNWRFDDSLGIDTPTWNQLWFVAYLWVYSMVLALVALAPAAWRERAQSAFDTLFGGWRLIVLPVAVYALTRILLADRFPETHGLVDDWYAHSIYAFAFFFGVGLGGTRTLWPLIARVWKPCAIAALIAWVMVAAVFVPLPEGAELPPLQTAAMRVVRAVQAWGAIIALLGFAQAFLNHDHPWRTTLNEGVFPAYIAHQTVILVVMYWLLPLGLSALTEFAILVAATVVGSVLFYLIGREIPGLRPLIGLRGLERPRARAASVSAPPRPHSP